MIGTDRRKHSGRRTIRKEDRRLKTEGSKDGGKTERKKGRTEGRKDGTEGRAIEGC